MSSSPVTTSTGDAPVAAGRKGVFSPAMSAAGEIDLDIVIRV